MSDIVQGDQKVSVHLIITVQKTHKNWWFEGGHHRIHSECGPCCTDHSSKCR